MAVRFAVASGNWSNTATWDAGSTLGVPTSSDDVYSNGLTVSVDTNFTVLTLNNTTTPRIVANIATPAMTSNTTPSGTAFAATTLAGTAAWYAFDQVVTSTNSWSSNDLNTGILGYQFTSGKVIKRYAVRSLGAAANVPKDWTFQGSNDGVSYTTLDTVTAATFTSGVYVGAVLANSTSYTYYRINITAVQTAGNRPTVNELEMTENAGSGIGNALGGSFDFNTAGVTGNVTSSSPLVPGATNLIQVTATTGTVTLTLGGDVEPRAITNDVLISYTGNCNFTITGGITLFGLSGTGSQNTTRCINKTSSGTLTINGNAIGGAAGVASSTGDNVSIVSSAGNTVINGSITGGSRALTNNAVRQTAGILTVTGNVTGGSGTASTLGINFSGTQLTVNGNVLGGAVAAGILTSAPVSTITGNVTGGTVEAISSTTANQITINGTATASATANAVSSTNANGQVFLNGNMVNNNGKMAIYAPIVWLGQNTTTSAQFFTSGGADRTLYSADTVPNTPAVANVRKGTVYGAGNSLTGTLSMPAIADVRSGVTYDNGSVGTALFTTATLLTEMGSSANPVAVRLRNLATPDILGELMESYKK